MAVRPSSSRRRRSDELEDDAESSMAAEVCNSPSTTHCVADPLAQKGQAGKA